jgi:8-oxo-dGTP pyrophosphatase MutT (NUDIX family)
VGASDYIRWIRSYIGHQSILLPSASILIFNEEGKLLVGLQGDRNVWVIPGGAVDPGESAVDAAIREAYEETGLHIEITGIFGVFGGPDFKVTYPNGDSADYIMTTFNARAVGGNLHALDGEFADLRFVTKDELMQLELAHWARLVLPHAFDENPDRWWLRPTTRRIA